MCDWKNYFTWLGFHFLGFFPLTCVILHINPLDFQNCKQRIYICKTEVELTERS